MFLKHLGYQLRHLFTYFSFYWFQVSLALFAIFFVQIVQRNIDARIQLKGQSLLGADISIGIRGKWEGQEDHFLPFVQDIATATTEVIEVSAMVTSEQRSLLVNLIGIENNFPLYGDVKVSDDTENWRTRVQQQEVYVYQEVLDQLGVKVGSSLRIGEKDLRIAGLVVDDAVGGGFTGFLPKIYISKSYLEASSILGPMSSESRKILVALQQTDRLDEDLKILQTKVTDPTIRIQSRNSVSEQSTRILDYLTDYMGLISIVTILLTFFGSLYLFRHFFFKQLQNIAIFKSLGFSPQYINKLWIGQMLILSFLITLTTYAAGYLLFPLLGPWLLKNISKDLPLVFYGQDIYLVFLFSIFLSLMTHFLYSKNIQRLKPSFLLKQGSSTQVLSMSLSVLSICVVMFIGFTFMVSRSWIVTAIFVGAVASFFLLSYILLKLGFYGLFQLRHVLPAIKYVSLNFYRNSSTYLFLMISLSFGFTLLSFLPSIKTSLLSQLEQKGDRPKLFLFDIQDFQLPELKEILANHKIALQQESPMIRARLLKINGEDVTVEIDGGQNSTREEEQSRRFRNRAFNLSYRSHLSDAEKIVAGKSFEQVSSQYPKVSVEKRFASRMNMDLGDILTFDIQDIEVKAEIVNLRSVNWFTLQPNFFVTFEEGVLNDAPKTFLATIGHIENSSELQYELASKFPNISMVDLDRIIIKVLEISNDFEFVLTVMSYFCIIMGILVFLSIYVHFMERRRFDMQIMKVLGFSFRRIFILGAIEYMISLSYAVGLGIFIGSLLSYLLVVYYFDWGWTFDFKAVTVQSLIVFIVSLLLMVALTLKDFLKKPQSLLKTES